MNGAPILPGPGSYFDQDAELMLAFEVLEDIWKTIEDRREAIKKAREKLLNKNGQALYTPE